MDSLPLTLFGGYIQLLTIQSRREKGVGGGGAAERAREKDRGGPAREWERRCLCACMCISLRICVILGEQVCMHAPAPLEDG